MRNGLVVLGCVTFGFAASAGPGLVARAAEPDRWVERGLVPGGDAAQRRILELEQQLQELEAQRSAGAAGGSAPQPASSELDAALARNQELVARNRSLSSENQALLQKQLFEAPAATRSACEAPPDAADPREQLRYWAEQLRAGDSGFRGGLTPEQNAALNVLLRRERPLDPSNPWRGS